MKIEPGIKLQIDEMKLKLKAVNASIGRGEWRTKWYQAADTAYKAKKGQTETLSTRVFALMVTGNYISDDNLSLAATVLEKGNELVEQKKKLIEDATK